MSSLSLDAILGRLTALTGQYQSARAQRRSPLAWATRALDWLLRAIWHVWRNRRYLTPIKLINMALINVQARARTERVIGMPYRMKIEPTNICNTRCQLCPTGQGIKGRAKGKMDFARYCQLVDQLKRYLYTLDLSMWGDPLIVPDIYRMIRYAHDRGIWTYLSSNLHAFKPDRGDADRLIDSGLNMLTCSLHGATPQTFAIYQPGKDFNATLEKVRAIVETKQRRRSTTPDIQLNFVVTRHNEHEISRFEQLAHSLGCKAVFSNPSLNLRFLDRDEQLKPLGLDNEALALRVTEHMEQWLPNNQQYVIEPYRLIREGHYHGDDYNGQKIMACQWPWKDSVINWDGTVVTCCGVYETAHDMGNVFERPFHEIWNSRAYRLARRSFRKAVPNRPGIPNPCRECPGFMV